MNQAAEGRRKSYHERSLTTSKSRTTKTGRKTSRKKPDRKLSGAVRVKETTGMDKYGGHNHPPIRSGRFNILKSMDCPEDCPKRVNRGK